MRKYLLMAFAAMMSTVSINAQHEEGDITIQPRVGITLSNLSGIDDAKMKVNIAYGVEFERFFNDEFSLSCGLLFTDQGAKFNSGGVESSLKLYYAVFPLIANYYVLPGLALKGGLQPAYKVKARMEEGGSKIDLDSALELIFRDDDVKLNSFDLSIPVGLSYEYNRVTLDARYNFFITKVFSGINDNVRNQMITITLGYKF